MNGTVPSAPGRRTASICWFDGSLVGDDERADDAILRARANRLTGPFKGARAPTDSRVVEQQDTRRQIRA
jgi:hypothetical protein